MGITIIIDTREKLPYTFSNPRYAGTTVIRDTLHTGDLSLPGFTDRCALERKSIDDLIGCLKTGKNGSRERFERELARLRCYECKAVIVEASFADIARGDYRSEMLPAAVLGSIFALWNRYSTPFVFAGSRSAGEYVCWQMLMKFANEIERRHETFLRAQKESAR